MPTVSTDLVAYWRFDDSDRRTCHKKPSALLAGTESD